MVEDEVKEFRDRADALKNGLVHGQSHKWLCAGGRGRVVTRDSQLRNLLTGSNMDRINRPGGYALGRHKIYSRRDVWDSSTWYMEWWYRISYGKRWPRWKELYVYRATASFYASWSHGCHFLVSIEMIRPGGGVTDFL